MSNSNDRKVRAANEEARDIQNRKIKKQIEDKAGKISATRSMKHVQKIQANICAISRAISRISGEVAEIETDIVRTAFPSQIGYFGMQCRFINLQLDGIRDTLHYLKERAGQMEEFNKVLINDEEKMLGKDYINWKGCEV